MCSSDLSEEISKTTSFAYDPNLGLGDLADLDASGTIGTAGRLDFNLALGIDLNAASIPKMTASALVAAPSSGRLSATASFDIILNDGELTVDLGTLDTTGNGSTADLLVDLQKLLSDAAASGVTFRSKPIDQVIHWVLNGTSFALEAINEDANGNGVLDPGEDIVNIGFLDSQLNVVTSLAIRASNTDPVVTELGFASDAPARSILKGFAIDTASLTGSVEPTATDLEASGRFAIFGVETSGGGFDATATGLSVTLELQNPSAPGTPIDAGAMIADLGNINSYVKIGRAHV